MKMKLTHIEPHPQLKGYVSKMWVFESSGRVPAEDMRLVVPNGMVKLTIPFRNGVSGRNSEMFHLSKESRLTLIGIGDIPAIIDVEEDAPSGTIGIEFSPAGAYRLFQLRQSELKNRIFLLEDVWDRTAREVQEMIANQEPVEKKLRIIQQYLVKRLRRSAADPVIDYCIRLVKNTNGLITMRALEEKTGYSSRWLYDKFMDKVGVSPKSYASIIRFQQFYEPWARNAGYRFKDNLYDYFYDQAHFIKEFKRFTGLSPLKYVKSENEFGRIFYRE
ncbi:MAG TPA: helix-turn-helix domain-containing protein [Chitinophaga sp.]|uniref:helix-turn-helix domain-containing protein n=1 Tax=Chitinophaga sp. TaxID=1869181 RepID=UPI002DBDAF33|nr:helix-turn-helix domain-containing protein [Chitinophaga sp.]HEU4556122.1 helix-turn-helix domain-containing protein [Chitinophaga sp.]